MSREIKGQIHNVSIDYKIISIQIIDKLEFFYLQPRFVKEYRKYLYPGVFVTLTCDDKKFKIKRRLASRVIAFEKILGNRYHRKFSYFDHEISKQNIIEKLNKYDFRLFLDLEMTLQRSKTESEEIVQIGAILVDKNNRLILDFNEYIKPTQIDTISRRTLDFLNISEQDIDKGISYQEFYNYFKTIILRYRPCVIIWGSNDIYALDNSYNINKVSPIFYKDDFINMQQILKKYYNFNYELGLFSTAKIYQIDCGKQIHNAYEDAFITRLIFNKFYELACSDTEYAFIDEVNKYIKESEKR